MCSIDVNQYFERLTAEYLNHRNDEDSKCKKFRTVMENFFEEYVVPDHEEGATWNDLQRIWYQGSGDFALNRLVSQLRVDLNHIVHEDRHVAGPDELYYFYRACILVIINISGVQPDARTRAACGEVDESYLSELNEQQRDIVLDGSRIVYVNAGPGTGKTHLLVHKIVDIIARMKAQARIVAMSYTRTSAASLSEKLDSVLGRQHILPETVPYSGTIHSYCLNCMRQYRQSRGERFCYSIADDSEIAEIVDDIYFSLDGVYDRRVIDEAIRKPEEIRYEALREAIADRKDIYQRISVGEILSLFLKELKEDEDFLSWCRDRVNYLLVDEAQDLTAVNYSILAEMLDRMPDLRLFLVGDPRQNIFGFLGGSYKNLNVFLEHCGEGVARKYLSYSYRCPQKVLDYTNSMVFSDCENIELSSKSGIPGRVSVLDFEDEYREAEAVVKYIRNRGDRYSDVAILASTLWPLSKIVDRLNDAGISFVVKGGGNEVKRHIRALACMNRFVESGGRALGPCNVLCDKLELPRCRTINQFLASDVGRDLSSLQVSYGRGNISFLDLERKFVMLCKKYLPGEDLDKMDEDFSRLYEVVIRRTDSPAGFSRLFKMNKKQFETMEVDFRSTGTTAQAVTISTIHSAKGLEWDCVIMPCMCDHYFPNARNLSGVDPQEKAEAMNAEKKLLFVGVTRSRNELILTYPTYISDTRMQSRASRFLGPLLLAL